MNLVAYPVFSPQLFPAPIRSTLYYFLSLRWSETTEAISTKNQKLKTFSFLYNYFPHYNYSLTTCFFLIVSSLNTKYQRLNTNFNSLFKLLHHITNLLFLQITKKWQSNCPFRHILSNRKIPFFISKHLTE